MTVSQLTLEDIRQESAELRLHHRYGEGARKVVDYLKAHPGWNRDDDITSATGQRHLTARVSEARDQGWVIESNRNTREPMLRLRNP